MGSFYGSIHVRSDDRAAVLAAAEHLARKQQQRFLVAPAVRGWIAVYPSGNGQDERLAALLAKRLPGEILQVLVHDDDIFAYGFYRDGKRIDQYNSRPDYFQPVSERERKKLRGRPETVAHLLVDPTRLPELEELLSPQHAEQAVFASETLGRFAELLALPNARTAYEYLMQGEADDIEGWPIFTHVPDLTAENAAKKAAADRQIEELERWRQEGLLLHRETRPGKSVTGFTPYICPDGAAGFFVCWGDPLSRDRTALEHWQPPWHAAAPTGIDLAASVWRLAVSPSGRHVATAHAAGDWHVRLWDVSARRMILEVPHRRVVSWAGFTADEKRLITLGAEDSHVTAIETGQRITSLEIAQAKLGALHPGGTLVVADELHCLHRVDPATGAVRGSVPTGDRTEIDAARRMELAGLQQTLAHFDAETFEKNLEAQLAQIEPMLEQMAKQLGKQGKDAEQHIQQMREQMVKSMEQTRAQVALQRQQLETGQVPRRGLEIIFGMEFTGDGRRLCIGTNRGLRLYDWDQFQAAADYMPAPALHTGSAGAWQSTPAGYVYGLAIDNARQLALFGGLDGRIESLDLTTGRHTVLKELPGKRTINSMVLARDGNSLACCVTPDMLAQGRTRPPAELQVWNVARLLR